jgi:hypothetical protein
MRRLEDGHLANGHLENGNEALDWENEVFDTSKTLGITVG